jgi:hypothetical protein
MPKKISKLVTQKQPGQKETSSQTIVFPEIETRKDWIESEVVVPDQIIVFHVGNPSIQMLFTPILSTFIRAFSLQTNVDYMLASLTSFHLN